MLTPDERRAVEAYFTFCDADCDGYITISELRDALTLHLNNSVANEGDAVDLLAGEKDLESFFAVADYDEDQRLTLDEVIAFHEKQKVSPSPTLPVSISQPSQRDLGPAKTEGVFRGRRFVRRRPEDVRRR